MKKIVWLTADYFVDVDLPIIPELAKHYQIKWFIVLGKACDIDYKPIIKEKLGESSVEVEFIYIKSRNRDFSIIGEYISIFKKMNKEQKDLYYFDIGGSPFFYPLSLPFIDRRKTIVATHNVSTPKGAVNPLVSRLYMSFILRTMKNFHVFSASQREVLKSKSKKANILTTPLALKDFGRLKSVVKDKITFLFFGHIREYKGIDILIEAANRLNTSHLGKFKVIIAGACDNWERYEKLIDDPNLFELYIQSIPNEEVADLFSKAHYAIFPYRDIAQSGALTVALNYNLPVIVSDLEAFKETVEDRESGYFFEAGNIVALVETMKYVIDKHETNYNFLQARQKALVEAKFGITRLTEKYMDFFNKVIEA